MREIKFRAWDKIFKEFHLAVGSLALNLQEEHPERYVALQYTGLKDKNGKEIYEGDIVETVNSYNNGYKEKSYKELSVVRFEYGSFVLNSIEDGKEYDFSEGFVPNILAENHYSKWEHQYKIVGNIYENLKLLK